MSRSLLTALELWAIRVGGTLPPGFDASGLQAAARYKRVALHAWLKDGLAQSPYGEVHLDGAAAFAVPLAQPPPGSTEMVDIGTEHMTVGLIAILRLISGHAADNLGLSGDGTVLASLVRPTAGAGIVLVDHESHGFRRGIGAIMPSEGENAEATVDLTGLSSSWADVLAVARDLLSQIRSSYGSAEPPHIDENGALRILFYQPGIRERLREWASHTEVPVSEATQA